MQYNVYYYQHGVCAAHTQYGAAALYVPTIGVTVEIATKRYKVIDVVFMPQYDRFDVELAPLR